MSDMLLPYEVQHIVTMTENVCGEVYVAKCVDNLDLINETAYICKLLRYF